MSGNAEESKPNSNSNNKKVILRVKKRPVSALEPRDLEKAHIPPEELKLKPKLTTKNVKASGSLSKVTGNAQGTVPFVAVLPSNAKKTTKVTTKELIGLTENPAEMSMIPQMIPQPSGRRKPSPGAIIAVPTPRSAKKQLQRPKTPKTERGSSIGSGTKREHNKIPGDLNVSSFAKSAAQSVSNAKTRGKSTFKPFLKTQVVLSPRFGPNSEQSNMGIVKEESQENVAITRPMTTIAEKRIKPIASSSSGSSINFSVKPMADFSPAKAEWVKMALGKLGKTWVASGAVPQYMMDFPEFQKKIGDLYDMAVDKKCNQLKITQESDKTLTKSTVPKGSKRTKTKNKSKRSDKADKVGDSIPEDVQKKMSDIILHLLLTKLMPVKEEGEGANPNCQNTKTPSSNGDSVTDAKEIEEVRREISKCYVLDGKIYPVSTVDSHSKGKHSFASLGESRKRTEPGFNAEYFRRIADLRGFEVDEVTLKYTKSRIFVEGKQPLRGDKNARQVREIIALPNALNIGDLKVMRGRKGLLVFEEMSKSSN